MRSNASTELVTRTTSSVESIGLRRAFGSPSTQPPQGYSVAWLNEQRRLLKEKAPDLQIAEWSMHPHDRVLYERNLSRAGYNPDVLPETTSWVSPMQWLQYSSPSLPGYQLGYVCALYAPSSLVFRWHDALVDSHMLMDIMSTRQKKYHHGKVTIPKAAVPILRLLTRTMRVPSLAMLYLWARFVGQQERNHYAALFCRRRCKRAPTIQGTSYCVRQVSTW